MVRWITERLGTASYHDDSWRTDALDAHLLDIRELLDGEWNDPGHLRTIIESGAEHLRLGRRLLICCDKGISRSNAIAVGALLATGTPYPQALQQLRDVGAIDVSLGMLKDVRLLYEPPRSLKTARSTRILVTGATGFIGRAVLKALDNEYELLALHRLRFDLGCDLLALDEFVNEHRVDTILHLAHPRPRNSPGALSEALAMMKTVLELCRLNNLRLVYLSSLAVFSGYAEPDVVQARSTLPPRPQGTYAETKYLCEQLIRCYQESAAIDVTLLRAGLIYGPNMDRGMFVPKFFEWADENKVIHTHRYKNGRPSFDFLYVDDLVNAIHLAFDARGLSTVHLGTGVSTTTCQLAQDIVRLTHSSSQVRTLEILGETPRVVVDPEEAAKELGFKSTVSLETGLARIWSELQRERDRPSPRV